MMQTQTAVEPKNILLGYRIKVMSKKIPVERYVGDIGTVTLPQYAKLYDSRSAQQRVSDLKLAGWNADIEPVYGEIKEGRNNGTSDSN